MPVYLDHAATTPILPEVLAAFTGALGTVGNPSSIHSQGQNARRLLEESRERVAASLGADPIEVVFTSGGTEAVNLAVKGLFWARNSGSVRPRILVPAAEHHATIDTVEWLRRHEGAVVDWIAVDSDGRVSVDAISAAIGPDVALVTLLAANNEVGTLQPVAEVAAVAASAGIPVHVDAISAYGHVPLDFRGLGVAAMSVSAHKVGGPLGIGALLVGRSASVTPLIHGGGQQRELRSGTQDVPAAVGFGVAAEIAASTADGQESRRRRVLRDRLIQEVRQVVPQAILRGHPTDRLESNAHFTFPGCEGDSLLFLLDAAGISVSTGSACQAGVARASHVLLAMGLDEADARGALRISIGHSTTDADVDAFLAALPGAVVRASRAGLATRPR